VADPAACRRAADVLDAVAAQRRRLVVEAQDGWRGRHRDAFDEDDAALQRRAQVIADELRAAAFALEGLLPCAAR
jgi:hypothetical protein